MLWQLVFAVFAAFGLLSALWAVWGMLLPACRDGWLLCPGKPGSLGFVGMYLWLRGVGLVSCPLMVLDIGLSDAQRKRLTDQGIEILTAEELPNRLFIGEESN